MMEQARRELASFPGAARLDAHELPGAYMLTWKGISHTGGGVIIQTRDFRQFAAACLEFLEFDAIKPKQRQQRALQPARKPAGRAVSLQHGQIGKTAQAAAAPRRQRQK